MTTGVVDIETGVSHNHRACLIVYVDSVSKIVTVGQGFELSLTFYTRCTVALSWPKIFGKKLVLLTTLASLNRTKKNRGGASPFNFLKVSRYLHNLV